MLYVVVDIKNNLVVSLTSFTNKQLAIDAIIDMVKAYNPEKYKDKDFEIKNEFIEDRPVNVMSYDPKENRAINLIKSNLIGLAIYRC